MMMVDVCIRLFYVAVLRCDLLIVVYRWMSSAFAQRSRCFVAPFVPFCARISRARHHARSARLHAPALPFVPGCAPRVPPAARCCPMPRCCVRWSFCCAPQLVLPQFARRRAARCARISRSCCLLRAAAAAPPRAPARPPPAPRALPRVHVLLRARACLYVCCCCCCCVRLPRFVTFVVTFCVRCSVVCCICCFVVVVHFAPFVVVVVWCVIVVVGVVVGICIVMCCC